MKNLKIKSRTYVFCKSQIKNFGIASFYSKYVIIGSGFAGMTLTNLLLTKPLPITPDQITLIDVIPDHTIYPILKYHCFGSQNTIKTNVYIPHAIPSKLRFRNNEVLEIDPKQNLILGDQSLRQTYDKVILACGKEADFAKTPGLMFALEDPQNPMFSVYEYEKCIPKMATYSQLLIKQFLLDAEFKLTKKNEEFLKIGGGNIIFSNVSDDPYEILYNMQMIILFYELIKLSRKEDFIKNIKFLLFLPISEIEFTIKDQRSYNCNLYFLKELQKRNIEIKWDHKLEAVGSEQTLIFKNNKINSKEKYEYNFALIMPHLEIPAFLKFNPIFSNLTEKVNKKKLKIEQEDYDNIFILGDAMCTNEDFLNKFDTNIFHQAQVLSNNLKVDHFRLKKESIREYKPFGKIYFDFMKDKYVIIDTGEENFENSFKILKKTFWNNFLFKHFYNRPEGGYAQKFLLERKFGVNII